MSIPEAEPRFVVEHDYRRHESSVVDRQALERAMFPFGQPQLEDTAAFYEQEPAAFLELHRRPVLHVL